MGTTHEAGPDEVRWVWPAACASHLFSTYGEFEQWRSEGAWRVRVSDAGEAVLLDAWREHMRLLAVRGLWCSRARVPVLLEDVRAVAAERGFDEVLGPLVEERELQPYLDAGMRVHERVMTFRLDDVHDPRVARVARAGADVTVREARGQDMASVLRTDADSFEPFWRYDERTLAGYAARDRVGVAVRDERVVGYTLSTVRGHEGSIGRLAVLPSERRKGIGGSLLAEAVGYLGDAGARHVALCTQEDNRDSRRLYVEAGFRESPGRLVSTVSGPLAHKDRS